MLIGQTASAASSSQKLNKPAALNISNRLEAEPIFETRSTQFRAGQRQTGAMSGTFFDFLL
jgi:hypothetical protein